jgi:hypothetical protein
MTTEEEVGHAMIGAVIKIHSVLRVFLCVLSVEDVPLGFGTKASGNEKGRPEGRPF